MKALVIPVDGPLQEFELVEEDAFRQLQTLVDGLIEALPLPSFIGGWAWTTAYINEEGKLLKLPFNGRATDFMVPGIGLFYGDYIAGPMVLCGFSPSTGMHIDLPDGPARRARMIADEAG